MLRDYTIWHMCWLYTGSLINAITKEAKAEFDKWRSTIDDTTFNKYMEMYNNGTLKPK